MLKGTSSELGRCISFQIWLFWVYVKFQSCSPGCSCSLTGAVELMMIIQHVLSQSPNWNDVSYIYIYMLHNITYLYIHLEVSGSNCCCIWLPLLRSWGCFPKRKGSTTKMISFLKNLDPSTSNESNSTRFRKRFLKGWSPGFQTQIFAPQHGSYGHKFDKKNPPKRMCEAECSKMFIVPKSVDGEHLHILLSITSFGVCRETFSCHQFDVLDLVSHDRCNV